MPFKRDFDYTSGELRQRGADYLQSCREQDRRPTDGGLARALGIPVSRLEVLAGYAYEYTRNPATQGQFREAHRDEMLQYKHLDALQEILADIRDDLQQNKDVMSLFRLKQAIYGGYSDKQDTKLPDLNVTLQVKGVGHSKDPFE